jgi:hypothetical protein
VVVALLPAEISQNTELSDLIGAQMAKGMLPMDIARKLYPHDRKKRLACYMRIRRRVLSDERVAQRVREDIQIGMLASLGPAVHALGARAGRGRVDAIKLLLEATGVHNPRVQHEHSGEIKIKLDLPRPAYADANGADVVDADVVED